MTSKKHLFVALVAGTVIAFTAGTSHARLFGHGSCGSHGGWGSGGSWGGSYGGSWGGSYGGSWGGSYGGGSCGSCGSYGGGYAYYGGYYGGGYASDRVISRSYVSSQPSSSTVVASAPTVKTSLTLHVPADAKVTLAGVETKQTGETRQFATTRLGAGQNWGDYKVIAEVEKNGQKLREERTISLTGGKAQELTINFDSTHVASN
jgi:uncharacterized protein (TIGR03000 family)